MRAIALFVLSVSAGACASSTELVHRSDVHLRNARAAYAAGDVDRAAREQDRAFHDYNRAAAKAYLEERPPPPPPRTPPLPERVFF
jgi:hypothetical protein